MYVIIQKSQLSRCNSQSCYWKQTYLFLLFLIFWLEETNEDNLDLCICLAIITWLVIDQEHSEDHPGKSILVQAEVYEEISCLHLCFEWKRWICRLRRGRGWCNLSDLSYCTMHSLSRIVTEVGNRSETKAVSHV